eukprot:5741478-Pyramimonas_sp.AAC.1
MCGRSFRSRNPLVNNANPYLERSRDRSKECLPCRNGQNWGLKGVSKAVIESKLKSPEGTDEFFKTSYTLVIFAWEDMTNDPGTHRGHPLSSKTSVAAAAAAAAQRLRLRARGGVEGGGWRVGS